MNDEQIQSTPATVGLPQPPEELSAQQTEALAGVVEALAKLRETGAKLSLFHDRHWPRGFFDHDWPEGDYCSCLAQLHREVAEDGWVDPKGRWIICGTTHWDGCGVNLEDVLRESSE